MNPNNPTQSAQPAHTPTPWVIERNGDSWLDIYAEYIPHGRVAIVAQQFPHDDGHRCRAMEAANAAFIVRACNSHAQLVAALEEIVRQTNLLPAHLTPEAVADFNAAVVVTVRNAALAAINAEDSQ